MSLINGLSAAGYAAGEVFAKGALADQAAAIQRERDLRLEEAGIRTEDRAVARADQQRKDQVTRIDTEAGKIADTAIESKRGLINSRITDQASWTPEQQAAVDQSLEIDRGKAKADPKTRTQAAINTGDIAPKDAAAMDSRSEIAAAKNDAYLQNVQAKLDMANDKMEMAKTIATIRAAGGGGSDGKPPSGYRRAADGNLEFIPGGPADPQTKEKPLPTSAAKAVLENQQNLRRAQKALMLVSGQTIDGQQGDAEATGVKGYLPNQLLNRVDPKGVDTRAAIADLGSLVIHSRSGAAVTAAEFPRLAPFIPTEKDDAASAAKKLKSFVSVYSAEMEDTTDFYRASGYKVPTDVLRDAKGKQGGQGARPAQTEEGKNLPLRAPLTDVESELRRRGIVK